MASYKDFLIGGISGMAGTVAVQPIDNVKVRMQKTSEVYLHSRPTSIAATIREIHRHQGIRGFYVGLSPALMRQLLFGTTRLGLYRYIRQSIEEEGGKAKFRYKVLASLVSGLVASLVGNPFDLAIIRMQSDPALPVPKRRKYKSLIDAIRQIVRREGLKGLWSGATPTVLRTMAINLSMMTTYDQLNEEVAKRCKAGSSLAVKLGASAVTGLFVSSFSLPFDNIKTKLMSMAQEPDGQYAYQGFADCLRKSIAREGFKGLWTGFRAYYLLITPNTMVILLVQDLLHAADRRYTNH